MRPKHLVSLAVACVLSGLASTSYSADEPTVQVHVATLSEAGQPAQTAHAFRLGGSDHAQLVVRLNVADVQHVLLHPDDLREATLTVKVTRKAGAPLKLSLLRLTHDVPASATPQPGDIAPEPIASATIESRGSTVSLGGALTDVLNADLKDPGSDHGVLLALDSPDQEVELVPVPDAIQAEGPHAAALDIRIRQYPNVSLFPAYSRVLPDVYTNVIDGHLSYNGQRLRLWGVCRHFWGGPMVLDRIQKLGFNAIRLWGPRDAYDPASASKGEMVQGEGSLDNEDSVANFDKFFADAKQHGMFIWMAGLHYDPLGIMHKSATNGLDGITADDSFMVKQFGSGSDWEAWKKAVKAFQTTKGGKMPHLFSEFMYFDPRLQEIYRRQLINLLNHVNPYTGKRYADEEAIAIWELHNEEGLVATTTAYGTGEWPAYFRDELQSQWCKWLSKRYSTDEALRAAWGELKPEESLAGANVKVTPFLKERNEYPAARGSDVVHFFCDLTNNFNAQMRDLIRSQGKPGVGSAVVPVVFDTQALPSAPWLSCDSLGDAVSFGTYQLTSHSSLTMPPSLFIMENHTVANKPMLIYETQSLRPDSFRTEYPLRVAALASWQNWDGVFFHYWKGEGSQPDEGYQAAPTDYCGPKGYTDGGVYPDQDPAYCAALSIAGRAFLSAAIAPAKDPVVYHAPLKSVYSYNYFNGIPMRSDTFTRGAVVSFDDSSAIQSSTPTAPTYYAGPVKCGSQITYDWQNGRLIIDTPTFKACVGQSHGGYQFSDGIALRNVSTPFATFAMFSADGKPLAGSADASHRIITTAVFDANNTGFRADPAKERGGESSGWDTAWANSLAATVVSNGIAPVIVDPVNYELDFPTRIHGKKLDYDFALRQTAEHPIDGGGLTHEVAAAPYMSVIQIDDRGAPAADPQAPQVTADDPIAPGASKVLDRPDPKLISLYMPLPAPIGWGESYDAVQQYLHDSTMVCTSISKYSPDPVHQQSIKLTDVDRVFGGRADAELTFSDHRILNLTATYYGQPSVEKIIQQVSNATGTKPVTTTTNDQTVFEQHQGNNTLKISIYKKDDKVVASYDIQQ